MDGKEAGGGEELAKQTGLIEVIREQIMSSVVNAVGVYDIPFLKAGLQSLIRSVDTEHIMASFYRFPQALLSSLVSLTSADRSDIDLSVESSGKNVEIMSVLATEFFMPFLNNLQHEEKLLEKLKATKYSGYIFESYILAHKTVAEFIIYCSNDTEGMK